MTCYNRRDTTLRCLERLYAQKLPDGVSFRVFLVDDGCSDGTGVAVKAAHPDIQVIQGSGELFWCNGMRLAWEHAAKEDPDFYLWLNDDVQLREDAIDQLLRCWLSVVEGAPDGRKVVGCPLPVDKALQTTNQPINSSTDPAVSEPPTTQQPINSPTEDPSKAVIVIGSTCDPETGAHTYGGQRRPGKHPSKLVPVPPQETPVECDTFQGNVVLVSRTVYQKLGNMRPFGHAMGDTDYGLRARAAGCRVVVAPGFAGVCAVNRQAALHNVGFRKSWHMLMRRLPPKDYLRFLRVHAGSRWPFYWLRPYVNLILSRIKTGCNFQSRLQ